MMETTDVLDFTGERIVPGAKGCEPNFAAKMYQEHIVRYLFAAQLVEGKAVLDVGCGVGYGAQYLAEQGAASVRAFDLSDEAIQHARGHYSHPNVRFEVGNAEAFSFDAAFDIVTCFELIEHVDQPEAVMANIRRALKPDGILVISTPRALEVKRTHFHMHEFSVDEFDTLVKSFFKKTQFYVENNHFTSLVTKDRPSKLERLLCLNDQFGTKDADVFIVTATSSETTDLPPMESALSIDNDVYVTMLERDVAILHKAEEDFINKISYLDQREAELKDFMAAESARMTAEANALAMELARQRERAESAERSAAEQRERAETAERFANDWHDQLMTIRRSVAWRMTKPFRAIGRSRT